VLNIGRYVCRWHATCATTNRELPWGATLSDWQASRVSHPGGAAERKVVVLRTDPGAHHRERLAREFPDLDLPLAQSPQELAEVLGQAVALIGGTSITAELLADAPRLRWLQATSAGVEDFLIAELRDRPITLTNFSGVAAPNIAEHVLALVLAFARGLKPLLERQARRDWPEQDRTVPTFELSGQTLGIVGMGDIGDEVAKRAHALGMRILATQRHEEEPPPYVERLLTGDAGLDQLLPVADHVVLCLPLTTQTRHTIGAPELARMRSSAYLYNIGRGDLIDQDALVEALCAGRIAGAGLDVATPEPLPPDSRLWDAPHVLITDHTAGETPRYWDRGIELVIDNLRRFLSGGPLRNVVDTRAGY
jgi:phosphoglycerate dehydrogenase-like enzyme